MAGENPNSNRGKAGNAAGQASVNVRTSAIQGRGLFAEIAIRKGQRVVEYIGDKITKEESLRECEKNNPYIFACDDDWDLNGNCESNVARFANHSCAPNCEIEIKDGRIWIVASRDIAAGEEISFNYGYDLEDYRDYPCHCGAAGCVGYIVAEEFFPVLRLRAVDLKG